jgi:hypothetical protein
VTKAAALVIPAVLLIGLSGCFPTGEAPEGDGGAGEELEGGSTACVIDKDWHLDIADAATKLGAQLASNGLSVQSSTGEGDQSFYFDQEGIAGSSTNLTYTMVVDMGDGLVMTMAQHHEGAPGGNWAWDGEAESTIVFDRGLRRHDRHVDQRHGSSDLDRAHGRRTRRSGDDRLVRWRHHGDSGGGQPVRAGLARGVISTGSAGSMGSMGSTGSISG